MSYIRLVDVGCIMKISYLSNSNTEDASSGQQWCCTHDGVPWCGGGGWHRATPMEVR